MKHFLFSVAACLFIPVLVYTQPTNFIRTYGVNNLNDECKAIIQTLDGGILLAGYSNVLGGSSYDVLLYKTDASGNVQWKSNFSAPADDYVYDVIQNSDSTYTLAGESGSGTPGTQKALLMKVSPSGALLWSRFFNTHQNSRFFKIVAGHSGGYVIAGKSVDFNPPFYGGLTLTHTDTAGITLWAKHFGDTQLGLNFYIEGLVSTADSGYTVFGSILSGTLNGAILIHYNSSGDTLWTKRYTGLVPGSLIYGNSFTYTHDGGYLLNLDYALVKTDSAGNIQWANDYFQGYGLSKVFETEEGSFVFASSYITSAQQYQIYYFMVDAGGSLKWSKKVGDNSPNIVQGGMLLPGNHIALTGRWDLIGMGDDMFILKDSLDGTLRCLADTMAIPVNPVVFNNTTLSMFITAGDTSFLFNYTAGSSGTDSVLCMVTTGIENNSHALPPFDVYPNPATDVINFGCNFGYAALVRCTVYNTCGKALQSIIHENMPGGNQVIQINLKDIAPGIYFLKIKAGSAETVKRLVKLN